MSAPLPLGEALDALRDPAATERFSALGEPILVVDVSGACDELAPAARLAELPCPCVAWRADAASAAGAALLGAFDVHCSSEGELAPVVEAAKRNPQASAALAQLLRHSERLSVHEALVAESLVYSTLQSGPEFAAWLAERGPRAAPPPAEGPVVLAERRGAELHLTLNRPQRRNAYSSEMRDALCEALAVAEGDPGIERVVIDGAGPCFSAGGDLDEFGTHPDPSTAHAVRSARNAGRLLARIAERAALEARVHGACVGAGVELPAFATRVVARPDAWFQLPEVSMGLVPGAGGTASLPRRIGRQRTAWLALSGARLDAQTALAWGLVDAVEPA
jgi:enoyl-CoA hydratase/carnithine racemase